MQNYNCLVTKLQAAVTDSDLEKLGVIKLQRIEKSGSEQFLFQLIAAPGTKVTVIGDGYLMSSVGGDPLPNPVVFTEIAPNRIFYSSNGNYTIEIDNKYDVNFRSCGSTTLLNIADLYYTNSDRIMGPGMYGDLSVLRPDSIKMININNLSPITGTITDILKQSGLETLKVGGTLIEGFDISELAKLDSLTGQVILPYGMSGSLESYVIAKRNRGFSTGSISFAYLNDGGTITFNGVKIVASSAEKVLSWTESTITWDGTTIDA